MTPSPYKLLMRDPANQPPSPDYSVPIGDEGESDTPPPNYDAIATQPEPGNMLVDADGYPGTAYLFPLQTQRGQDLEIPSALNALFFDDPTRWPTEHYPAHSGTKLPLRTWLVDCPDLCLVTNWLAINDADQKFLPGAYRPDLPSTDCGGTVPYVNPATMREPDWAYALNYLLDNSGSF